MKLYGPQWLQAVQVIALVLLATIVPILVLEWLFPKGGGLMIYWGCGISWLFLRERWEERKARKQRAADLDYLKSRAYQATLVRGPSPIVWNVERKRWEARRA